MGYTTALSEDKICVALIDLQVEREKALPCN